MRMTVVLCSYYVFFLFFFVYKEKLHHFWLKLFFSCCWHRSKCNIFSLNLLKTSTIFLHQNRELSWRFYIFERDMQLHTQRQATFRMILCFWCCDVIFIPRYASFQKILWFEQDLRFLLGGYFPFSGYPTKKWIVPINAARFPWLDTIKIWKSPKFNFRKNSVMATISHIFHCNNTSVNNWRQNANILMQPLC